MESTIKYLLQILVGVAGLVAAFKAIMEWRKNLRWRQAEMAKTCLDDIWGGSAHAALKMLDWTGLLFKLPDGGSTAQIDHEQRRIALRIVETVFPPDDPGPFIRDAFDALFDGFERLEHFIRIKLIRFEDVEPPFRYYVGKLASPEEHQVIEAYLNEYGFELATSFLDRFTSWRAA